MLFRASAAGFAFAAIIPVCTFAQDLQPPRAGKVEILKASEVKPGMKAVAWTVFQGDTPEAIPIEIIGNWKNMWGPGQDVILGKMGGKAERTNVAGGMSGSPVYIDGKLMGAVALRLSTFSPDAICGITPIELMLEINEFDKTRPADARTPDKTPQRTAAAAASSISSALRPRKAGQEAQLHRVSPPRAGRTPCSPGKRLPVFSYREIWA